MRRPNKIKEVTVKFGIGSYFSAKRQYHIIVGDYSKKAPLCHKRLVRIYNPPYVENTAIVCLTEVC